MAFSIDGVLMFSMDGMDADITFSSNRCCLHFSSSFPLPLNRVAIKFLFASTVSLVLLLKN